MNYYNEFDPKAAAWLRELIKQGLIPPGHVDTRSITEITPDELKPYTQCHFFAGICGWSLALQLAQWPTDRPVWTGSCPCQPFSIAGKGLGIADERHLWPAFFNLIRECRPECVFGEQVASAIGKGWLDGVSADLESEGYACGATVLGAHSVGAPHIRQRLYWVANATAFGSKEYEIHQMGTLSEQRRIDGWMRVVYSADCDEDGNCPVCGIDFADCGCPGPTQDGYQYEDREDGLWAFWVADPEQPGQRGGDQRGSGTGGQQVAEQENRPNPANQPGHGREDADWMGHSHSAGSQPGQFTSEANGHGSSALADGGAGGMGHTDSNGSTPRLPEPAQRHEGLSGVADHTGSPCGAWDTYDLLPCTDGKARRVESGTFPLAHGVPGRVGILRGYGNAIVPQVAQAFIQAFLDSQ